MNYESLLHWMSHTGEGSWAGFRDAVAKLIPPNSDLDRACRTLRVWLSDFGHADFFIDGSTRWRILPPTLAGLPLDEAGALFTGARTPRLVQSLLSGDEARACKIDIDQTPDRPSLIRITGPPQTLAQLALSSGIRYIADYQSVLSRTLVSIQTQIETAPVQDPPINWTCASLDFSTMTWAARCLPRAACEFSSRFGARRYYLHERRRRFRPLRKREAIYAAAALQGIPFIDYDVNQMTLSVHVAAPLPEPISRIVCLCSGAEPQIVDGRFLYARVPPGTAAITLASLGQFNRFRFEADLNPPARRLYG
jgi:hypothetical protein